MVRDGQISWPDAKRVLKQYWWIVLISIIGCTAIGALAFNIVPKRYTSQTIVLIDPPTVSTEIVKPVVSDNLGPRLASMQQQILSRTRLEPLIQRFDLYQKDRNRVPIDELVIRLRTAIEVAPMEPMAGTSNRQLPGFLVKVTFDRPQLAQQICSEVTSMFMAENSEARVEQGRQATSFLSQQLEDAKSKLDAQDAILAQFKQRYLGSLPDQEQTNLSLLTGMNSQLEANTQTLSRAQQEKAFNESLLSQQEANWRASQAGQRPETADQQLAAFQDQLAALRSKYTEEHPDVVKMKALITELRNKIAAESKVPEKTDAAVRLTTIEPPQIQQLRAKLRQDDLNIADLLKRQSQIEEQIRVLQGRVQSSPAVEQQYKELTRNYQTALDFYNNLLKNRDQAQMATNLEQRQEGEQFRILDPPNLPDVPSFPKKLVFLGGGAGAGLALGLGILFLFAMSDKSMYTERDVETWLKLPVLAMVPNLELPTDAGAAKGSSSLKTGRTSAGTVA